MFFSVLSVLFSSDCLLTDHQIKGTKPDGIFSLSQREWHHWGLKGTDSMRSSRADMKLMQNIHSFSIYWTLTLLDQGSANCRPWNKYVLSPVITSKVLLGHNHAHSIHMVCNYFCVTIAMLSSCDRLHMSCSDEDIYPFPLSRKCSLTPC